MGVPSQGDRKEEIITTLFDAQVIDDAPTSANSDAVDTEDYGSFGLFLDVLSSGSPTDIVFKIQFSNDGGTTWFDLQNDFWGDLRYEDTQVASGIKEVMKGPCIGRKMRLRMVGTGTAAADKFTVSAYLSLYR